MRAVVVLIISAAAAAADSRVTKPEPSALVLLVDAAMTPERLDVVNRGIRDAMAQLDERDRVAIVTVGAGVHLLAPLQAPHAIAKRAPIQTEIADKVDLAKGLGRAATLLSIKAARFERMRIIVISDRDAMPGASSYALKLRDAGWEVSGIGVGGTEANRRAIDAIAISGGGASYHVGDGKPIGEAIIDEARGVPDEDAYVIIIDHSDAMLGVLETAKAAVLTGIESIAPDDFVAVIELADGATVFVRPQRAANRMRIAHEISRLRANGRNHDLREAVALSREVFTKQFARMRGHLIIVASGDSPRQGLAERVSELAVLRVKTSGIAVTRGARDLLEHIAHGSVADAANSDAVNVLFQRATSSQ